MQQRAKPSRKHADRSDALTGEPLRAGTLRLLVRDWDDTRQLYRGQPIPTRIHGRAIDGGDDTRDDVPSSGATKRGGYTLGAPVFAHGFLHYMAPVLPESVRQARARRDEWWSVPSAAGPLIRRFGLNAVTAAAAVERGADVTAVAREMHVTPTRVHMWQQRIRSEFARMQRDAREQRHANREQARGQGTEELSRAS